MYHQCFKYCTFVKLYMNQVSHNNIILLQVSLPTQGTSGSEVKQCPSPIC